MDTPGLVLLDRLAGFPAAIGALAPGTAYGPFNCMGYTTLCIDIRNVTIVAGNTITITWDHGGGAPFEIETYVIPVTGGLGIATNSDHHLKIPVHGRNVVLTYIIGAGGVDFTSTRVWLATDDLMMEGEYCARSTVTNILAAGNAVLLSGMQTGFIMRVTNAAMVGRILLGPTVATAVFPLNIGEVLIYEMKGQIVAVNPGGAAVDVNIIETRE
jgi:hypothetical protein